MECQSCKIQIDQKFTAAMQENKCPCCGKEIMSADKMSAYLELKILLEENIKSVSMDDIVSLIVSNEELVKSIKSKLKLDVVIQNKNVVQDDGPSSVEVNGIRLEKMDPKNAKKMLDKMRKSALSEAINDRYDMEVGGDDEMLIPEGPLNIHEQADRMIKQQKQQTILTGSGGKNSFSRSG